MPYIFLPRQNIIQSLRHIKPISHVIRLVKGDLRHAVEELAYGITPFGRKPDVITVWSGKLNKPFVIQVVADIRRISILRYIDFGVLSGQ